MDYTMTASDHASVAEIIDRELLSIPGWCTPEKAKRMAELAVGAKLCVELGVFGGRGLVSMALAIGEDARVDGIDPYAAAASLEGTNDAANDEWWSQLNYDEIARAAQSTICRLGMYSRARLVRMRSRDVVSFYVDGSIDVLHQDSNHSEEITCEEVEMWAPKMRSGGRWIFDDADWPTTQKAQAQLLERGFVELENHGGWKVYQR